MTSNIARKKYRSQGKCCFYCGKEMKNKQRDTCNQIYNNGWTKDHFIPRAAGGKNTWANMVLACLDCNIDKANRLPTVEELNKFFSIFPKKVVFMQQQMKHLDIKINTRKDEL